MKSHKALFIILLLAGLGTLAIGGSQIFSLFGSTGEADEIWSQTPGKVKEAKVELDSRTGGSKQPSKSWRVFLQYEYTVGNITFDGWEAAPSQPEMRGDPRLVQGFASSNYKPGTPLAVYYNPDQPSLSRLSARNRTKAQGELFSAIMTILIGVVVVAKSLQQLFKPPGPRDLTENTSRSNFARSAHRTAQLP